MAPGAGARRAHGRAAGPKEIPYPRKEFPKWTTTRLVIYVDVREGACDTLSEAFMNLSGRRPEAKQLGN